MLGTLCSVFSRGWQGFIKVYISRSLKAAPVSLVYFRGVQGVAGCWYEAGVWLQIFECSCRCEGR